MKHVKLVSRELPKHAISIVEADGLFQKITRMMASLTSVFNFLNLIDDDK